MLDLLAFDFGGTQGRCALAAANGAYDHVITLQRATDEDGARWLERLLAAGRTVAAKTPRLTAVCVSFGGPVSAEGRVLSMHVRGWEKIDLVQAMRDAFKVPVYVENDANCGALGEFYFGAGRGCRYMAYFTVSTGIGGGVILDGKLLRGAHGMAAEFGQIVLESRPDAPQYAAGKPGVLEALASGPAIAREGRAAAQAAGQSAPENLTAKDVFDAAQRNEKWAAATLDTAISHLARGAAAAICAYDLERVVFGGGVALAGDALFIPLRTKVRQYVPHFLEGKCEILPAELGDLCALLGAATLSVRV